MRTRKQEGGEPLAATFDVHVAKMSQMDLPGPEVYWMSHWDEWFEAWLLMVVARNDEHVVVMNTGPPRQLDALNELWRGFHPSGRVQMLRNEDDIPERRLAALGISPDDVDHLIITPLVGYTLGSLESVQERHVHLRAGAGSRTSSPRPTTCTCRAASFCPLRRSPICSGRRTTACAWQTRARSFPGSASGGPGSTTARHWRSRSTRPKGTVVASDCGFAYGNIEGNHYLGSGRELRRGDGRL